MIKLFIFLSILLFNLTFGANIISLHKNPVGYYQNWENTSNWNTGSIPTTADTVSIPTNGTSVLAITNIDVVTLTVGANVNPNPIVQLGLRESLATNQITTYPGSVVIFLNTSSTTQKSLTVRSNYFDVNGLFIFDLGTNYLLSGAANFGIRILGSTFENRGKLIINSNLLIDTNGQFNNLNSMSFTGSDKTIIINGKMVGASGSSTTFSGKDIKVQPNGKLLINEGSTLTTSTSITQTGNALLNVIGSQLNINNFNFNPPNPTNILYLSLFNTSQGVIKGSTISVNGVYTNLHDNSLLSIESSNYKTNYTIQMHDTSQLSIKNSTLTTTGYITLTESATLIGRDSKIIITDNSMELFHSSNVNVFNSNLQILSPDTTINGLFALYNNSNFIFFENSKFTLDGNFMVHDQATLGINGSSIIVYDSLTLDGDSFVKIFNNSKADINGVVQLLDNCYLIVESSQFNVKENITLSDTSTFSFAQNSNVTVNGKFYFYNSQLIYISFVNDSTVTVNGFFVNAGFMNMFNSYLNIYLNFTTYGNLKSNNSDITVKAGLFNIDGTYDGTDSGIQVNQGTLYIKDNAVFKCLNCEIKINGGGFVQGKGAKITLTNTILYNIGGKVESSGPIQLNGGGISNGGTFILQSDINPNNPTVTITNGGTFTVNGQNISNVNAPFSNTGSVNLNQNTKFIRFDQNSGSTKLGNNSSLSTNNIISMNGGNIEGVGSINAALNNDKGSLGGKKPDQLTINGVYSQSENGTIVVTIDSEISASMINFTKLSQLNGTIIIRVNEDLTKPKTTSNLETRSSSTAPSTNGTSTPVIQYPTNSTVDFKKVVIITYNKDTGKETVVNNDCNVKYEKTSTSFSVLLTPNDEREECQIVSSSEEANNSKKPLISKNLMIGIIAGGAGLVLIIVGVSIFVYKSAGTKLAMKLKKLTRKG